MKRTWHFVLMIVGLSLAAAGLICMLVASWDKLAAAKQEAAEFQAGLAKQA